MVASIAVSRGSIAVIADYYLEPDAAVSYFIGGALKQGIWIGKGAAVLGVQGPVTKTQFTHMLSGRSPLGLELGLPRNRPSKPRPKKAEPPSNGLASDSPEVETRPRAPARAFDVTFSVPKSVSILHAISEAHVQRQIEEAALLCVRRVINWLENNVALSRRGKKGAIEQNAKLLAAVFQHQLPRNHLVPQLHFHTVISLLGCNAVDGRWSMLNGRPLHEVIRTLGPMFRSELAKELTTRLGVELVQYQNEYTKKPECSFEIKGIPKELMAKYSERRKEILEQTELSSSRSSDAKARALAARKTRKPKPRDEPNMDSLRSQWKAEAASFGLTAEKVRGLMGHRPKEVDPKQLVTAIHQAAERLTEQNSTFSRHALIRESAESLQAFPISGIQIAKQVKKQLETSSELRTLTHKGTGLYTTQSLWKAEEKLIKDVEKMSKHRGVQAEKGILEAVLSGFKSLSEEQANAVRYATTHNSSVRFLTGVAGAGKTHTLGVIKQVLEFSGKKVIGGSISGAATQELAGQAKIESRTVASYLANLEKPFEQKVKERLKHDARMFGCAIIGKSTYKKESPKFFDKDTVLILDEASMLGTRETMKMVHHALKAKATILFTGDTKQLTAVAAGNPFLRFVLQYGDFHMSQDRRLKDIGDRDAAKAMRNANVEQAIGSYVERDKLTIGETRTEAAEKLVNQWLQDGNVRNPERSIILTQTRADAAAINKLCQKARFWENAIESRACTIDKTAYHVGDRVLFHKEFRQLYGIENGYKGTVTDLHRRKNCITILLDNEPTASEKKARATREVHIQMKELRGDAITLGYAATTHKMQGGTVDQSYVLLGGSMTCLKSSYVQLTRARKQCKLFVDKSHAGEKLETIIKSMKRDDNKEMAHDIALQIERENRKNTKS